MKRSFPIKKLAAALAVSAALAELLLKWRMKERLKTDPVEQTTAACGEHGAFIWGGNTSPGRRLIKAAGALLKYNLIQF